MSSPADSLQERYGARSRTGQVVLIAVAAAVVLGLGGWLVWAMLFHSSPEISSSEIGHEVVDDHLATIRVSIEMDDGLEDVTCGVRAISVDKTVVGEQTFTPDPDEGPVYELQIQTERRATTVEWLGCKAKGQPRYR